MLRCYANLLFFLAENIDHNSQEAQLLELGGRVGDDHSNENFQGVSGARSQEFPSIQLDILQAATKQFSDENKLGEGGFGPVYKVTMVMEYYTFSIQCILTSSFMILFHAFFRVNWQMVKKLQLRGSLELLGKGYLSSRMKSC